MPIRQRGPSWQVDVRLPDGKRYRTTVPTEAEAKALETSLTINPQQRRAMRLALRQSRAATSPAPPLSSEPSGTQPDGQQQLNSTPALSAQSVLRWPGIH
jgi:hypothetical protein